MIIHDQTRIPEFLAMLEELSSTQIEVGILGDSDSQILMIASVNEFGCSINVTDKMRGYLSSQGIHLKADTTTIEIPERSFIRAGFTESLGDMESKGEALLGKVIKLELPVSTFFNAMGEYCVGLIQEYMTSLSSPANSSATVKLKGSSNPLMNTGRLRQSIAYKLVRS